MTIWFAIPTANPALCSDTFAKWKAMGYRTAALVNTDDEVGNADVVVRTGEYRGWAASVNFLATHLPAWDWLVSGGDDVDPDPNLPAELIAQQCTDHFGGTFGVMQPTGDPQGNGIASRICGSPWIGREFARRWNGGRGALWSEYFHYFADQELKESSEAAGLLWQRPDLCQSHRHWSFEGRERPAYLSRAAARWESDARLFKARRPAGFAGHEPVAA